MLIVQMVEACARCRGTTMWRLGNGNVRCQRCGRHKRLRRRRSRIHLVALVGLAVVLAAWVTLAFAESSPRGESGEGRDTDAGSVAIEVSLPEFVELQALDDSARRERFGLPGACTPGMTAMMVRTPTMTRIIMVIRCTANSRE